jgi:protein-tyrosine phosphatase
MFFSRKKESTLDLSWLNTDIHSHLIPGIDDGSPDIQTSVELVKGLSGFGYKKLVTTPHVLWEIYPNTSEIIMKGLADVRAAIREAGINIELDAAAEYFIDDHFEQQVINKEPLLPVRHKMVLVEFSMITAPLDLKQVIFELQMQNYQPLLAHPERYAYLMQRKNFYDELKDIGCFFQLNLMSLTGYYGGSVRDIAEYLIRKNYYNFAGTDLHNARHLTALQKLSGSSLLKRLQDSGMIKNNIL